MMLNWLMRSRLNRKLLQAVDKGDAETVSRLLGQGADVNANDGYDSALSRAGRSPDSNAATLRLLLEWGANINGAPSAVA